MDNRSVSGMVQDAQNNPLKDVHVELTDANGAVVGSSYTDPSGRFEFSRLSSGTYTVVATSGLQQSLERVDTSNFSNTVNLRIQGASKPADGVEGNSISIAQYRVPAKAREAYRKAHEAVEKGKMDDGHKYLTKALELCPSYADALTLRGVLELNQRDPQAAIADLDKAIKADGNYAMAYMVMGSALNMESKFDEAIRSLQRGQSLAPNYWQGYFEMGKSYIGKADYPAALRQLERAESMAPADYPLISLLRAHALLAMKQFPEAMAALQAYLQKDPHGANSEQAHKMLEEAQAFVASKK
ncbi:MAG TPA: tetratricopeptide repeat protein [Candidatus Dormibacteraeota bacterium]|nr:tetratricopeptide repeat protein [Candidatus Dormibacteraeota bacterium]